MAPISLAALALLMMPTLGALPVMPAWAAFLGIRPQPEKIARMLVGVQAEWKAQIALIASCDSVDNSASADDFGLRLVDCHRAPIDFVKSCETVVQAVTEGSSGDRDVVEEYMKDICGQDVLKGWRQDQCIFLTNTIVGAMSFKAWAKNGVVPDKKMSKVCADMLAQFISDEQVQRVAAEDAKRKAEMKTKAEQVANARAEVLAKAEADGKANADNEAAMTRAKAANLVASRHEAPKPRVNASAKQMANATAASSANA